MTRNIQPEAAGNHGVSGIRSRVHACATNRQCRARWAKSPVRTRTSVDCSRTRAPTDSRDSRNSLTLVGLPGQRPSFPVDRPCLVAIPGAPWRIRNGGSRISTAGAYLRDARANSTLIQVLATGPPRLPPWGTTGA